ncbi:GumC family protein [Candidatus Neomarinimicrobiota bacterium]
MTKENPATGLNELNLRDYFNIFFKRRRSIVALAVTVGIIAAVVSLMLPKTYTAAAVVMPPSPGSALLGGISMGAPVSDISSIFSGVTDETNRFLAILKSRTMAANVITQFNLLERYDQVYVEDAIHILGGRMNISVDDEGMIRVEASTKTGFMHLSASEQEARILCADIANFSIDELDRINAELQTKQAKYTRLLIENLYNRNRTELEEIEAEMEDYGETYGIISLPDQLTAAVLAAAALEEQITLKEVELAAAEGLRGPDHPEVQGLEIQVRELRKKMAEFKFGSQEYDSLSIFPLFQQAPELSVMYFRLTRRMEAESLLYQFLTQQYEQAKVQEARDTPTVQVLDRAVVPMRKSKPFRMLIVLVSVFMAAAIQAFYILVKEQKIVMGSL